MSGLRILRVVHGQGHPYHAFKLNLRQTEQKYLRVASRQMVNFIPGSLVHSGTRIPRVVHGRGTPVPLLIPRVSCIMSPLFQSFQ